MPKTTGEKSDSTSVQLMPLTLLCDGISDPGMLGTLIRSAVAASCSKILITRGSILNTYLLYTKPECIIKKNVNADCYFCKTFIHFLPKYVGLEFSSR